MKTQKINLRAIRSQARQVQIKYPRLLFVYLLPCFFLIATSFLRPYPILSEDIMQQSFLDFLLTHLDSSLFPVVLGFTSSIFLTGALASSLKVLRETDTPLSFSQSFTLFQAPYFSTVFLTLFLKRLLLFLWSFPRWVGVYLFFYASSLARLFVEQYPTLSAIDFTDQHVERLLLTFTFYLLCSLLCLILGSLLYIPQYYAYSQVELLLCDALSEEKVSPTQLIKQSRKLMKGYKGQRLLLDLQLLPWHILNWITFGFASFSLLPYLSLSQVLFYKELMTQKRKGSGTELKIEKF